MSKALFLFLTFLFFGVSDATELNGGAFSPCTSDSQCHIGLTCFVPMANGKKYEHLNDKGYCIADYEIYSKCNTTDHCRFGFVCTGGNPSLANTNDIQFMTGVCRPNIVLRQLCLIHEVKNGLIGKSLVAMAIISLGGLFLFGKVDHKPIIFLAIAIGMIFGSMEVIYLIIGERLESCELIRTLSLETFIGIKQ